MRIPKYLSAGVVLGAWLLFIASFYLPATNVIEKPGTPPGTPLTGWQAFASIPIVATPMVAITIPKGFVLFTFPLINFVMFMAPIIVLAWSIESWVMTPLFVLFGIAPWFIPKELSGDLFIGFYVWDASFFAMAIGCVLVSMRRRQVIDPPINLTSL